MMDRTDSHFRVFARLLSRHVLLYTEMVTMQAVIHGKRERVLGFEPMEHPLALQVGGDQPDLLAQCARVAQDLGYDEINLNVGCPSDRVQSGNFGACLMKDSHRVAACVTAMREACTLPVTVKHRIGVDDIDRYEDMAAFVDVVAAAGCDRFTVHARKAWLSGLSPRENREIPPLRYEDVYRLKRERPELVVEINGGIRDLDAGTQLLTQVDAVMIGRFAWDHPYAFAEADRLYFGSQDAAPSRAEVVDGYLPYASRSLAQGHSAASVLRVLLNLFVHRRGARQWKWEVDKVIKAKGDNLASLVTLATQLGTLICVLMLCACGPSRSSAPARDGTSHASSSMPATSGSQDDADTAGAVDTRTTGADPSAGESRLEAPADSLIALEMAAVTTFALRQDGAVLAWGCNRSGALGLGISEELDTAAPVVVPKLPAATRLSVSRGLWTTACAFDQGGEAWCWGSSLLLPRPEALASDLVSTDTNVRMLTSPRRVAALDKSKALAWGDTWSCRIDVSDQVECWRPSFRSDPAGSSGPNWTANPPIAIPLEAPARALAIGSEHACVILDGPKGSADDGAVACFGDGKRGQLDGTPADPADPAAEDTHDHAHGTAGVDASQGTHADAHAVRLQAPRRVPGVRGAQAIAATGATTCALSDGALQCWGGALLGHGVVSLPLSSPAVSLLAGDSEICIVDAEGLLRCMRATTRTDCIGTGLSDGELKKCVSGQLGYDSSTLPWRLVASPPVALAALSRDETYCVTARDSGRAMCAGTNEHARNGDGSYEPSTTPKDVLAPLVSKGTASGSRESAASDSTAAARKHVQAPRPLTAPVVQSFEGLPENCTTNQFVFQRAGQPAKTLTVASAWASLSPYSLDLDFRSLPFPAEQWRDRTILRGQEERVSVTLLHEDGQDLLAPDVGTYAPLLQPGAGRVFAMSWMDLHFFDGVPSGRPYADTPTDLGAPTGALKITRIDDQWICGTVDTQHGDVHMSATFSAQRIPGHGQ